MYSDAEILRCGNEQLLDDLEEGLIILEDQNLNLLFKNESAKSLRGNPNANANLNAMMNDETSDTDLLNDMNCEMFASCNEILFKE